MNPIEIVANSPISAAIAAGTVLIAIVHELALATHTPAARRLAQMIWGPFFVALLLFAVVAVARLIWIFSE